MNTQMWVTKSDPLIFQYQQHFQKKKIHAVVGKGHHRTKRYFLAKWTTAHKGDGMSPLSCPQTGDGSSTQVNESGLQG